MGGPVHINMPTQYSPDFSVDSLPVVRKISRYYLYDKLPEIRHRDVVIFIGTHKRMSQEEIDAIDKFCEIYNAVVFRDSNSGYYGKYGLSMFGAQNNLHIDLLIHLGEISCAAYQCKPTEVWRVNEDGELRDTFRKLTNVFEMPEILFFERYNEICKTNSVEECGKYTQYKEKEDAVYARIREVPFSNGWIASYLYDKLPKNSLLHLGIVSTYFAWSRFKLDSSIEVVCNQGGFGIDGNMSTLIGAAIASPRKICYCFLGDLAFFYDLNVLGNKNIGNNVRILLVNNGQGVVFRNPGNFASMFEQETEKYISAGGHYGSQSKVLVRHFAEDLGFEYLSAVNKEEFIGCMDKFVSDKLTDKPILFECFVSVEADISGNYILRANKSANSSKGLKNAIKSVLGENGTKLIKELINGHSRQQRGSMSVDVGHN